jgi:branched-chain amino acid transport system substrate-binding protein
MKKTVVWTIVVGIVVIIAIFAIFSKNDEGKSDSIKIGYVGALTGDGAVYGEVTKRGIDIAIEEINSQGGINGKKLEMSYEDGKCDGKSALSGAQKLHSQGIDVIIGVTCSGEVLSIAPFAEQNKIVLISPSGSNPDITNAGDYIFRNNPPDAGRSVVFVKKIMELGYKNLAIVSEQTDFSQGLRKSITDEANKNGLKIVFDETFEKDSKDFRTILTKLKNTQADALVLLPQTDVTMVPLYSQSYQLGVRLPTFVAGEQMTLKTEQALGSIVKGVYVVEAPILDPSNEIANNLMTKYKAKYGDPTLDFYIGAAYDNAYLIKKAIEISGSEDSTKIKDALYKIKDFRGAIGTYIFDSNGDIQGVGFVVNRR